MSQRLGNRHHRHGSRSVIVGSIKDLVVTSACADADVIVMRADRDIFILQLRIITFHDRNNILRPDHADFDVDREFDLFGCTEGDRRSELRALHLSFDRFVIQLLTVQ